MGSLYSAVFEGVAATVQQDFFELVAPAAKIVVVHAIELSQVTEVGDAMEEFLVIKLKRATSGSTSGSGGGSNPTPAPLDPGFAAAGSTVEINNTTKVTGGTSTTLYSNAWNIRSPFLQIFTPELRPVLAISQRFTVELATTPTDSVTFSGTIWFEEIG